MMIGARTAAFAGGKDKMKVIKITADIAVETLYDYNNVDALNKLSHLVPNGHMILFKSSPIPLPDKFNYVLTGAIKDGAGNWIACYRGYGLSEKMPLNIFDYGAASWVQTFTGTEFYLFEYNAEEW